MSQPCFFRSPGILGFRLNGLFGHLVNRFPLFAAYLAYAYLPIDHLDQHTDCTNDNTDPTSQRSETGPGFLKKLRYCKTLEYGYRTSLGPESFEYF